METVAAAAAAGLCEGSAALRVLLLNPSSDALVFPIVCFPLLLSDDWEAISANGAGSLIGEQQQERKRLNRNLQVDR